MAAEVTSIRRDTDATRMADAALAIREAVDAEPESAALLDLAALLDAVGGAIHQRHRPPMTEIEMWRWSAVVGHARRIAHRWTS